MRFTLIFLVVLILGVCDGFAIKKKNVTDPCRDKLDRGKWCESSSNRYYYNKNSKQCKGFHYTGCGRSKNNFKTLEDCQTRCVRNITTGNGDAKVSYMF